MHFDTDYHINCVFYLDDCVSNKYKRHNSHNESDVQEYSGVKGPSDRARRRSRIHFDVLMFGFLTARVISKRISCKTK